MSISRESIAADPGLPARIVQSLRRDATHLRAYAYLDSAADLIELLLEPEGIERRVRIENTYADSNRTITNEVTIRVRKTLPLETEEEYRVYLADEVYPHTGTGHDSDCGSHYEATSIDGIWPAIHEEWSD